MGRRWRVSFEMVNPIPHPEYYLGDNVRPGIAPEQIPDEHWHAVSRETSDESSARSQIQGLREQVASGELLRNVKLEASESTITWQEVV